MFNLYKNNKIIEEEKKRIERELMELKMKKRKDKKNKTLKENYEKRISSFIYDMIGNPIKVAEFKSPIYNTRALLLEEENNKIIGAKGIVLKKFITERERVQNYMAENDLSRYDEIKRNKSFSKENDPTNISFNLAKPISNKQIIQPSMRYKARTDLERIFDTVNNYSYGKLDRSILNKQLKELDLDKVINLGEDENTTKDDDQDFDLDNSKRNNSTSFLKTTKHVEKRRKRVNVNLHAKKLFETFHQKTHFKGMADFSTSTSNNHLTNLVPKRSGDIQKARQSLYQNTTNYYFDNVNKMSYYAKPDGETDFEKKYNFEILNTVGKENMHEFSMLEYHDYDQTRNITDPFDIRNPFIEEKKTKVVDNVDHEALRKLKEIAYAKDEKTTQSRNYKMGIKFDFKKKKFVSLIKDRLDMGRDEKLSDNTKMFLDKEDQLEKITIGSNIYNRTDLNKISKQALLKCNYFQEKNKNNHRSTKPRQGKLMITQGLSISEFEDKYGLKLIH